MVNFIERLKVCWHVLTKRNYVYFGLDNDAFVFDEDGNYVDTKLNKVASYSVISNKKINTEYGVLRFKEIDSVVKFNIRDMIAWLEKQGEQKPDDNVEPKFKVGNWYQCTKDFFGKGVTFDKNTAYYCAKEGCLQNEYGCHIAIVKDLYDNFKLWTIEDANDGDVLMTTKTRNCPFIYRKTNYNNNLAYYYAGVDGNGDFCEGCLKRTMYHFGSVADITPATKEQRDLLFKKMKEASYEWDAEKKELKKIEPKKLDADKVIGWLVANICDFEHYVKLFKKDFELC